MTRDIEQMDTEVGRLELKMLNLAVPRLLIEILASEFVMLNADADVCLQPAFLPSALCSRREERHSVYTKGHATVQRIVEDRCDARYVRHTPKMQQPSPSVETERLLARLSQRAGVQSTLILSRDTGAIVRSSGLITAEEAEEEGATATANGTYLNGADSEGTKKRKGTRNAEEVARLVWNLVKSCGCMIEELNGENDEAKLLRVRTKKNEMVVVPDAKFLLVVLHDTPPA